MSRKLEHRVSQLSEEQRVLLAGLLKKEVAPGQATSGQLVAYVTGEPNMNIDALKGHLVEHLPEHMIPTHIIQLSELPKLPNGKINTAALPNPERESSKTKQAEAEANRSVIEDTLANIWQDVLGFEPVGLQDNFFEIGGDSILSIQIVAKARENGINFTPNQLFQHQTIAQLAKVVEQAIDTGEQNTDQSFDYTGGDLSAEDMSNLMQQINEQGDQE
jgi:aryl carrier-like protein